MLKILMVATLLATTSPVLATTLDGTETYDLLFRNGTLSEISEDAVLVYDRAVQNTLKPELAERDTGKISLTFLEDGGKLTAIDFRQDDKHRSLGRFPTSVGNPMIMFFYESVIRDMAESAGGSPFYIRNRVKDALVQSSDVQDGTAEIDGKTITTQTVKMLPFASDPNRDRMQGFGDLELTVTMSDDVPGWYVSFEAEAPGAEADKPVYHSKITFDAVETPK